MKLKLTALITCGLMAGAPLSYADNGVYGSNITNSSSATAANTDKTQANTQELVTYLKNFGLYLGYDVTQIPDPVVDNTAPSNNTVKNIALTSVLSLLTSGALPPQTGDQTGADVDPNTIGLVYLGSGGSSNTNLAAIAQNLNALVNLIYQSFQTPNSDTTISASTLIDQEGQSNVDGSAPTPGTLRNSVSGFRANPTSQAIQNILTTPPYSYCSGDYTPTGKPSTLCNTMLFNYKVMSNVLGTPPNAVDVTNLGYNARLVPQLNANNVLTPLLYNTQSYNSNTTSSPTKTEKDTANIYTTNADGDAVTIQLSGGPGLQAQSQAQVAANFARYFTGQVTPMSLADRQTYQDVYNQAMNTDSDSTYSASVQAQSASALLKYLTGLRSYAAQASVGISNVYYLLGMRMPNPVTKTSQASQEYLMATRRLFNPNYTTSGSGGTGDATQATQWMTSMETASPAVMQREMLYLMAEINYQLYLNRQLTQRILLTNTATQLQTLSQTQSVLKLVNPASSSSGTVTTSSTGSSSTSG